MKKLSLFFDEHPVIKAVIVSVLFVIFITLVIVGQKNIGWGGLTLMLLGLAGLLFLLYIYNKKYQ